MLRTTAQYRGTDAADYCGLLRTVADYCYCVLLRIHIIRTADCCGLLRTAADCCGLLRTAADYCALSAG